MTRSGKGVNEIWKAGSYEDRSEYPHGDGKAEGRGNIIVEVQTSRRSLGNSAGNARHKTDGIECPRKRKDQTVNHYNDHRCADKSDRAYHTLVDKGANPISTSDKSGKGVANNEYGERRNADDRWKDQEGGRCRDEHPRRAGKVEPVPTQLMCAHQGANSVEHHSSRRLVEVHQRVDEDGDGRHTHKDADPCPVFNL